MSYICLFIGILQKYTDLKKWHISLLLSLQYMYVKNEISFVDKY